MVVVSHGSEALVAQQLERLAAPLRAGTLEVVVVSNSGDCGRLAATAGVTVLDSGRNLGFARACGEGAARARGDLLLFCNPDVTIDDRVVAALERLMDQNPGHSVIAPITGSAQIECNPSGEIVDKPYMRFGAVFMIRRSALAAVGGWDGNFFLWWEDTDLELRLRRGGHRIGFAADLVIPHTGGHSTTTPDAARNRLLTRAWISSRCYYLLKHHSWLAATGYCAAGLATNLVRCALRRSTDRSYHRPSTAVAFFALLLANCWRLRRWVVFDGEGYRWAPRFAVRAPAPAAAAGRSAP